LFLGIFCVVCGLIVFVVLVFGIFINILEVVVFFIIGAVVIGYRSITIRFSELFRWTCSIVFNTVSVGLLSEYGGIDVCL
jgi:hypothetical protein